MKKVSMILHSMRHALLIGGVVAAMALNASTASATTISTAFNFSANGQLTANTGDVTTATTITSGAPNVVGFILTDNTGLVAGQAITLTSPTPVTMGATFTKTFSTATGGTFVESLTVTLVTPGPTSLGITATGTIHQTVVGALGVLTDSAVFYSAAYTQNGGPGAQINGSFNNSTIPPGVPEPSSIALMGSGLVGIGAMLRRRKLSK